MAKPIKIKFTSKKMLGVSAKAGEIGFGTHTQLTHYKQPNKIELRLLKAQEAFRKTSQLMKKITPNRSIKTMLVELKRVQAINQFSSAQRMALLSNYNELQVLIRKTTNPKARKKLKRKARSTYARVKNLEKLMNNSRELEENLKRYLTLALTQKEKTKTKKTKRAVQKTLSEAEQNQANQLLDRRNTYTKRITKLQNEIKHKDLSTTQLINKKLMLKEAELELKQTDKLLKNLTTPLQKSLTKKNHKQ
ncbi:MAG: hypothetical protein ACOX1V_00525 [Candidatus Iainarchaeum sp.]|jgi:hypothetical protein